MQQSDSQAGDPVVYRVTKHSPVPGPRAKNITPALHGDDDCYQVDKYWVVDRVLASGALLLRTRKGKRRVVRGEDPNLRPASWWESWRHRDRFPASRRSRETSPDSYRP